MKKTIKKILMAMCLIAMAATAAACGNNNAASSSSPSAGSSGVQQTVLNERATEKVTEKATEKKSGTGSGSSKSDKDKKSKSSKSDKDKKSSSSKSDKKNSSSKNSRSNNNNSNNGGGEITYYYTTTTTGGSTGGSSGSNSSAPNQNSSSGSNGSSKNNNSGSTGKSNGKSNNSSSSQADPHAGKTWHEAVYETINHPAVTENVWVVDQPATTEPVYETHDVTICNTCGADITDCVSDHGYNHMINGENASYHNEWREIQVGTKTIPEKGHWEKRIVKPAWTEKKLVREAGWY